MTTTTLSGRLLPSVVQPPTIRFHPQEQDVPGDLANMTCPNCGSAERKGFVLTVDVQLPDNPSKRLQLLHCSSCTAHFYDSQIPPDYAEPALNNRGRVPFYVQQGAGVSLITRPLAQIRRPPGSAYMEVGCGFGFGLDFAINTKGWQGVGIDPAPLAALGRDALGLPIELRYLRDDDESQGTMDIVMGSEVIEHVTSPSAFVRTLRAMLKPGGVLVLTTPNGEDIAPSTAPGIIIPLLSPSLHLVIQNRHSLETLLRRVGFSHVHLLIDSHSLVAFASDAPLDLEEDRSALRTAYRDHLERRAAAMSQESDLFIAYAGRAFTESVNDSDMPAADRAWAMLVQACRTRYGISVDAIEAIPQPVATCSLEEMARLVPLNLGGLLYARGIRRLAAGTPRSALERQFLLSAEASAAMRRALGELAMEDGQTEDIGWTATAEALLCAVDAGSTDILARLQSLAPAPNGGGPRRQGILLRAMTNLVNAGQYASARALVAGLRLEREDFARGKTDLSETERDALFCLAVLDVELTTAGRAACPAMARERFAQVRTTVEPESGLWWASLRGETQALELLGDKEGIARLAQAVWDGRKGVGVAQWAFVTVVNAGQYDAARALASESGLAQAAFAQPGVNRTMTDGERDTVFALAVLDVQTKLWGRPVGDPTMARGRFVRVRHVSAPGSGTWLAALRGELQALDMLNALDEAARLTSDLAAVHPDITLPADILARIGKV